jgi:hypothetical protein
MMVVSAFFVDVLFFIFKESSTFILMSESLLTGMVSVVKKL